MELNSQYFSEEQIKAGQLQKLLDFLMGEAYGEGDYYNDIHIKPADCGAFVVEWVQLPWSHEYGGNFEYIEDEQIVMSERVFPDGHYELCYDDEDYREKLDNWLKENPGWVKTEYGTWTNEKDDEKYFKYLEEEAKKFKSETHYENGIPQED